MLARGALQGPGLLTSPSPQFWTLASPWSQTTSGSSSSSSAPTTPTATSVTRKCCVTATLHPAGGRWGVTPSAWM